MAEITKRALLGAGGLAVLAAGAAQAAEGGPFVTRHSGTFNGRKVDYTATVGETVIAGPDGQPTIRFVSIAYVKDGGGAGAFGSCATAIRFGPRATMCSVADELEGPPLKANSTGRFAGSAPDAT